MLVPLTEHVSSPTLQILYPSGSSSSPLAHGGPCKRSSFTWKSILRSSGDWPITLMFRNIISTSLGKWRNNRSLNSKYFANYPCGYFALNTNDLVHADFILWKSHLSLYHHPSEKSKSETECPLPGGHFYYCLLRPQAQYIYVPSSRVYINTSEHPINHFFLASTFLGEVYAPDLVETRCNSFLSRAQGLMGQTQQQHRWAISRSSHYNQDPRSRDSEDTCQKTPPAFKVIFFYTKYYKQWSTQGWQLSKGQKRLWFSL